MQGGVQAIGRRAGCGVEAGRQRGQRDSAGTPADGPEDVVLLAGPVLPRLTQLAPGGFMLQTARRIGCSLTGLHVCNLTGLHVQGTLTSSQTPCCTAQMDVVPSKLAEARWVPPGDQQQQRIDFEWVSSSSTVQRQPLPGT